MDAGPVTTPRNPLLVRTRFADDATPGLGRTVSGLSTTETWEGKRLQKFVYKGIGNVMAANQGVLWPKR